MRKKLFAVIMSIMMMVTFMPAMAFATEQTGYKFSSDFESVVDSEGEWVSDTVKEFDVSSGAIRVTPETQSMEYSKMSTSYYDFTDAYFVSDENGKVKKTIDADDYLEMINQDSKVKDPTFAEHRDKERDSKWNIKDLLGYGIVFVKPAKMAVADGKDANIGESDPQCAVKFDELVDYKVGLQKYEAYDEAVTSLTFPVAAVPKHENDLTGKTECGNVLGLDKIKAEYTLKLTFDGGYENLAIHMDGMEDESYLASDVFFPTGYNTEADFYTTYCGANQNFKVVTKGITAKYREQFGTTLSETAPEMVNAGEYKFYVQLVRGTKTIREEQLVTVKVDPAPLNIAFKSAYLNFLPGTQVKASDVFTFKTALRAYSDITPEYNDYVGREGKAVDVYAADKAAAQKVFDACVQLKNFPTQGTHIGISARDLLEDLDKEVLQDLVNNDLEVAQLSENYILGHTTTDPVTVSYGVQYNDITAPNQTKTFHVKKAKALKSTKSFQLKATADYGTMTFTKMSGNSKIKVNSTGKVTVKKGLKKGKYVVKVKVKAPGTKTTKKVTVKVVK